MSTHERWLQTEVIDGEVGIVIDYEPGSTGAIELLPGAAAMVDALNRLDRVLLSSIDSALEPVSVVNDNQHSSLRLVLARVLKQVPDESIRTLEWREWIGSLLVAGKHSLLGKLEADTPEIERAIADLAPQYEKAPSQLAGYRPPDRGGDSRRARCRGARAACDRDP